MADSEGLGSPDEVVLEEEEAAETLGLKSEKAPSLAPSEAALSESDSSGIAKEFRARLDIR